MKRREFLKNSIGIAGFLGLVSSNNLIGSAMAEDLVEAGVNESVADLEMILQSATNDFNYRGHQVRVLRRQYRRVRGRKRGQRVEQWSMTFNGRELPKPHFYRNGEKGCFASDLLPFNDEECTPQSLAQALIDGHELKLYELQ